MPTTGAPGNIWYPDDSAPVAPLENLFLQLATSVNVAFAGQSKIHYVADLNGLAGLTATEGDLAHCDEGNFYLGYSDGTWVQVTPAYFSSASARNTAFNKASGAYRVKGAQVYRTDVEWLERYFSSSVVATAGWFPVSGDLPHIEMTVSNSISNNSSTKIGSSPAWTEVADPLGFHDPSSNPTRITPNIPGWYEFHYDCNWAFNGSGLRVVQFFRDGAADTRTRRAFLAAGDGAAGLGSHYEGYFDGTSADYVEIEVFQNSGGGLTHNGRIVGNYRRPS